MIKELKINMENNKLPTREELKTYFETDKTPTQEQFADLIDSFKHKNDIPTNREAVILANSIESINTALFTYNGSNLQREFPVILHSQGETDQTIKIGDTGGRLLRQYFLGGGPYTIRAGAFPKDGLEENEYYFLYFTADQKTIISRVFGNNLPEIPDGFEFGTMEAKIFNILINKQGYEQKINIINTNVEFINNTQENIQYKAESNSWTNPYTSRSIVTDHYDIWDYLNFYYKADLRKSDKNIICRAYDADSNSLLAAGYLYAGQNAENAWGGQAWSIRNIRIECNYF